jgi:protocatechuate 3,4-dioxygenase beta subunit
MRATLLLVAVVVCSVAGQAQPPRDGAAAPTVKGATIRGTVVAAATSAPLHRVRLTLAGPADNAPTGVTNMRGEFEIPDVPPGTYALTATRAGYLTIQYGQRRPAEAGRRIEVEAGQLLQGLEVYMFRGSVLAGRITDEHGDPYPAARVEAVTFRHVRGRRTPVTARATTANDVGEYRLSNLEPGHYQIRASSTDVWDDDEGKQTYTYAVTWYPGVSRGESPQTIEIGVGQEVGALDFHLVAGRAARITGVVQDASGMPMAGQVVHTDRIMRTVGNALLAAAGAGSTKTDEAGRFEFSRLAAGEYTAYTGGAEDRSSTTVFLDDGAVEHVVLSPRKPTALTGRIVTDEDGPPPFLPSRIRVEAVGTDERSALRLWDAPSAGTVRANWTFLVTNADGSYLFRVNDLPPGWMLRAVRLAGQDITDSPIVVSHGAPDIQGIEIVLSRAGAVVNATVTDAAGEPTAEATVVVFAEDRARWGVASRFIHAARPDDRGRVRFTGLAPGVYRIAARDVVVDGQWEDPDFLQSLLAGSARLELAERDEAALDITMGGQR